jgi:hypothetical protein
VLYIGFIIVVVIVIVNDDDSPSFERSIPARKKRAGLGGAMGGRFSIFRVSGRTGRHLELTERR